MTKLFQTLFLLLVALMMPNAAATALAQRANSISQEGSMSRTGIESLMLNNLNAKVNSRPVMAPAIGPYIILDKSHVRIQPNQSEMLTVGFYSTTGATELKVMSSDNTVATAHVVNDKIQVIGLKEGTAIITVDSKNSNFSSAECEVTVYTQHGDVNCDGHVGINDVTDLIDYLLGSAADSFKEDNADTDGDGNINIRDVTHLIDFLLGGNEFNQPETMVITVNDVAFKMVAVDGGTFTMGATPEQGGDANDNEKPAHQITLSSYYIGETEVTQALWEAVMGYNPSYFVSYRGYGNNKQRPVESISWSDCLEFITTLNYKTGYNFRLPTEAEWEFAARGGNKSQGYKFSGSNNCDDVAWTFNNIPSQVIETEDYGTQTVATKSPNELGLYDMSGNVWEWCQDWYCSYDLQVASTDQYAFDSRVVRGGSWDEEPMACRSSCRAGIFQRKDFNTLGLRLVLDVNDNPNFCLSESAVTVPIGGSKSVDILNGHGTYTVTGGGDNANGVINGQQLIVNGDAVGTTFLYVVDNTTGAVSCIRVYVTNEGQTFTVNGVTFKMMPVDGGTFMMGSGDLEDAAAYVYEAPAHQVTLSDYHIGQTEVTQELWLAVMGYNPSFFSSSHRYSDNLKRPIENVFREECQEFIAKLNELTGRKFRLPTEAEWEFAARGGNRSLGYLYAGSNDDQGEVSWNYQNSNYSTHPVATKAPNELGLYDITGNVWEYCLDWFERYTIEAQTNPTGPLSGEFDIIRGGSFDDGYNTVLHRGNTSGIAREGRTKSTGFRLVLDEEDNSKFRLSETAVTVLFGESRSINVLNGHGDYTVTVSRGDDHVDLELNNDCLTVHARTIGSSKIHITDNATGATTILHVIVTTNAQVFSANGVKFMMVPVDGGTFTMGATPEQGFDAQSNERPTHEVTLSGYSIGQTEVTQELWNAVMGSNPSYFLPYYVFDEINTFYPVESVSWYDCQEFIARLNQITGRTFRLPTEAEWEFAARGGNKSQGYMFPGSNTIENVAWFEGNSNSTNPNTKNVAQKAHNELGLFDMAGNVWEWCQDWYGSYSGDAQTNPAGPSTGTSRVIRGGSFGNYAEYCRVSFRSRVRPNVTYNYLGLRLVLDESQSPKFGLSETVIKVSIGCSKQVNILNGHGDYSITGGEEIVDIDLNDDCITVTGKAIGTTTVYVTDNATGMTAVLNVIVSEVRTFTVNGVEFNMVAVEGGTFTMGTTDEQGSAAYDDEKPAHEVTLSGYSIGPK